MTCARVAANGRPAARNARQPWTGLSGVSTDGLFADRTRTEVMKPVEAAQCFDQDQPVSFQPAALFCSARVRVEPVSFVTFPFNL